MKNGNVQEFVDHIHYGDDLCREHRRALHQAADRSALRTDRPPLCREHRRASHQAADRPAPACGPSAPVQRAPPRFLLSV